MQIKSIQLTNIGRFSDLTVPLASKADNDTNITVIVGNNGSGKTTVLQALTTALSWFVARLRREKGNGSPIAESNIKNGQNEGNIYLHASNDESDYRWSIVKANKGRISLTKSNLSQTTALAAPYRQALTADNTTSLPLVCFYSVQRYVDDISVKLTNKQQFDQFDGFDKTGASFQRFFAWFRQREDIENEQRMSHSALDELKKHLSQQKFQAVLTEQDKLQDKQLKAVRQAISTFMPGYTDLQVRRKPQLHMSINKEGETLDTAQLSQGEKSLLALVGDIARRLAMMNPKLDDPLTGEGIVLIDEVDMHLHSKWQRSLVGNITNTFPNCQFVLTTHSPLVISDPQNILCYMMDNGQLSKLPNLYGQDANQVLLDVMDTDVRNETVQDELDSILNLIQDGELTKAEEKVEQLAVSISPDNIELMKMRLLLRKMAVTHEKNN
jgi:predicted ATP-binding protein involved in virulence